MAQASSPTTPDSPTISERNSARGSLFDNTARIQRQRRRRRERMESTEDYDANIRCADRRVERLRRFRKQETGLQNAFLDAVKSWRERDPALGNAFAIHMKNCAAATSTTVLASDYILWFPDLPADVKAKLEALSIYYHGESTLMRNLKDIESLFGDWSSASPIHPELHHAGKGMRIEYEKEKPEDKYKLEARVETVHHCGQAGWDGCIGNNNFRFLQHQAQKTFNTRQLFLRVMADLEVRKTLLQGKPEHRLQVARWVGKAVELVAAAPKKFVDESSGNKELFDKVTGELEEWKEWSDGVDAVGASESKGEEDGEGEAEGEGSEEEGEIE